ncbi:AraC family transcriptional regulator [uncultured Deefgea sp.]|uniref:helix-turn-helix transcriptional regulator n=1 Tax=uncultured Deefgea sp. TaxID=1304914 RepID=UPI0025976F9C|nr:AraC family transcriptional regulator [uncultured Deefgea sp.]
MSMIYQELFEIGPETQQMSVGVRPFHHPQLSSLAEHHIHFMGVSEARGQFHVERMGAPFHILLIGVEGQGEIIDGERRLILGPNQLAVLPAYGHRGFQRRSEHWRFAWLLLDDVPYWNKLAGSQASVVSVQYAHNLFYALHTLCFEARIEQKSQACSALLLVMALLQRMLSGAVPSAALPNRLQQLFTGILYAPTQGWRVDVLAQQYGVSAAHFQRLCLKHLGATPQQLIIQHRMQRAHQLLSSGNHSVSDVAIMVGYEEVASFSRRFRSHFGLPPGEISRAQHRKQSDTHPSITPN